MSNLLLLAYSFLKIGIFGFGGGLAILPLIFQEVAKYGTMSAGEFSDLVAISQVTPGPMAINAATYVGFDTAGIAGAAIATVAVAIPGFILVLIAVCFLEKFKNANWLKGLLKGIRPATIGLIFAAVIFVASGTVFSFDGDIKGYVNWFAACIFAATIVSGLRSKINPIIAIAVMGAAGAAFYGFVI